MREILFRGMKDDLSNMEWLYGSLIIKPHPLTANGMGHFIGYVDNGTWYESQVLPSTIGMFTGLHDRDGKRIFEGDVLIDKYGVEYKVYCKYGVSGVTKLGYRVATDFPENIAEMQVTTNIHES